jgi:hypothetical protein
VVIGISPVRRALIGVVGFACAVALIVWPAGHASAAVADLSPIASKTFNDLSACMEKPTSQLNVLYLLDASSSLEQDTDPQRLRGKILAQAIEQLGSLSAERDVFYAVSSFDLGYKERKDWSQLTPDEATQAATWAEQQYGWWGEGLGTDWLSALTGGLATMNTSPDSKIACKLMVWVTDGGIKVGGSSDYDVNIAAMEEICGTNPLTGVATGTPAVVDAIRSAGIHLVAVALASDDFLKTLSGDALADEQSKFSYLVPVSEGSGEVSSAGFTEGAGSTLTYECGQTPVPDGWATGAFVRGASPIALAYQFSGITNRIRGGQPLGTGIEVPGPFEVEPGINRVNIQLAGSAWSITGPDGAVVASSTTPTQGPSVQSTTQGELVNVQIDEPALRPGIWKIDVTGAKAPAQVFVYALLKGVATIPELRVGESGEIVVDILSEITGEPVMRADYAADPIIVTAGNQGGEPVTLACTEDVTLLRYTCAIDPSSVGTTSIKARLDVNSRSGKLLYRYADVSTGQVSPQASYPQVLPDQISLTPLDGRRGHATGEIALQGPQKGTGQVCLPAVSEVVITSDVVDRASTYVFGGSAWGTCISVGQGETLTAAFDVSNEVPASGTVAGAFTVELKSSESDEVVTQQVSFDFDSIRQGTPPWWLLLLLLVLGLALPIILLYWQARSASKLVMKGIQVASVPVMLDFSSGFVSVSRVKPAGGQFLTLEDWEWPYSSGSGRSFSAPGGVTLRAITPRNPLGAITAKAKASEGTRVVSCRGTSGNGALAPMGLNPAGEWFISATVADLADPNKSTVEAMLVAFVNAGLGELGDLSQEMSGDVQARFLAQAWTEVRSTASSAKDVARTPAEPPPGWGDSPPATPATAVPPLPLDAPATATPPVTPGGFDPDSLWN